MDSIRQVFTIINTVWDSIFGLNWPGLSMSFKTIFIGGFVVTVTVSILKFLFGIGVGVARHSIESSIRIKKNSSSSPSYTYSVGVGSRVTHSNGFTEFYTRTK